jgi:hypothetical protein
MVKITFTTICLGMMCVFYAQGALAFSSKQTNPDQAPAPDSVWIVRTDGTQSCSPKSGQSLEEGAADLKRARVRVLESHKGSDGKMHMQMCGAPTGGMNAYLIPRDDLALAMSQGYKAQTK